MIIFIYFLSKISIKQQDINFFVDIILLNTMKHVCTILMSKTNTMSFEQMATIKSTNTTKYTEKLNS